MKILILLAGIIMVAAGAVVAYLLATMPTGDNLFNWAIISLESGMVIAGILILIQGIREK